MTTQNISSVRKVYLYVGYKCNMACKFCGLGEGEGVTHPLNVQPMFDTNEIIESLEKLSLKKDELIEISGGEPTMHPDIIKICTYAKKEIGCKVLMFSNGYRFSDMNFARSFAAIGVDEVVTALHSYRPDVNDYITQMKGSFELTLNGLKNYYSLGRNIAVKFIVMKANVQDAKGWATLVSKEFPKSRMMFNGLALWGEAVKNSSDLSIQHHEAAPYIEEAVDIAVENGMFPGIYFMPPCVFDPKYWPHFGFRYYQESVLEGKKKPDRPQMYQQCYNHPEQCSNCLMKPRCVWAWNEYTSQYGFDEITPIMVESNKPLRIA